MSSRRTPAQQAAATQVGLLLKHYRETFDAGNGRRGISQRELLCRMADADPQYEGRLSHTTVSRWESGGTAPTRKRLLTCGRALNLSEEEIAGLIRLAGLDPELQASTKMLCPACCNPTSVTERFQPTSGASGQPLNLKRKRICTSCGFKGTTMERWSNGPGQAATEKLEREITLVAQAAERAREALHSEQTMGVKQEPPSP